MARIIVRNLEAEVKARLQRRARRHPRSLAEEIQSILRDAAREREEGGLGSAIASLFTNIGLEAQVPEFRGDEVKPASFNE